MIDRVVRFSLEQPLFVLQERAMKRLALFVLRALCRRVYSREEAAATVAEAA